MTLGNIYNCIERSQNNVKKGGTYAKAVQFSRCCILDHMILFTALGIIHAKAIHAPNKWNCRSVTVATATPMDTTVRASTWKLSLIHI